MPSVSSCFLHVFCFRKVTQEKFSEKNQENCRNIFATEEAGSQKTSTRGPTGAQRTPWPRPMGPPRLGVAPGPRGSPGTDPWLLFILSSEKLHKRDPFSRTRPEAPPPKTLKREFCSPIPAPCRRWRSSPEASSSPCLPLE